MIIQRWQHLMGRVVKLISVVTIGLLAFGTAHNVTWASGSAQTTCPLSPRLAIGRDARITPGTANNIRAQAKKSAAIVGKAEADSDVTVLAGPVCSDGINWWQVKTYSSDAKGWIAEGEKKTYYIEPTASPTTEFTVPASSDAATPATVNITFENVSFTYNGVLSNKVQANTVFATKPQDGMPDFAMNPDYIDFRFANVAGEKDLYEVPNLSVYPVSAYTKMIEMGNQELTKLKATLKNGSVSDTDGIPELPILNAAQMFHAQVKFMKFNGIQGIRYLSAYSQDVSPVTNERLRYRFVGLTSDGKYFISAVIPVQTPLLPKDFDDPKVKPLLDKLSSATNGDVMNAYIADTTKLLNQATTDDFTPNLEQIDQFIATLQIQ